MSRSTASSNRHRQTLGILLGLGLLMAGCIATSTPEDTIKTAVSTAKHSRVRSVQKVMTGSALDAFGTKEGLETLREKLTKIVSIDSPQLIASEKGDQGDNHYGDIRRVFNANVSGLTKEGKPATYTARVICDVDYEEVHTPYSAGICTPDPNGGPDQCAPDTPAYDWEGEVQDCRVSDLVTKTR